MHDRASAAAELRPPHERYQHDDEEDHAADPDDRGEDVQPNGNQIQRVHVGRHPITDRARRASSTAWPLRGTLPAEAR
jgi:hypothetical protein